jgi:hypothetical protein
LFLSLTTISSSIRTTSAFTPSSVRFGTTRTRAAHQLASTNNNGFFTDDEWHPHDPAETTPQLLAGIWLQIAHGTTMVKGVSAYI